MKHTTLYRSTLAIMAITALSLRIYGAEAKPDPIATIQAITNAVERGNAWTTHIIDLAEKSFPQSEEHLEIAKNDLSGNQLANLYARMAILAVTKTTDTEKVRSFLDSIKSLQDDTAQTEALQKRFEDYKIGRLCWAISRMTNTRTGDPGLAEILFKEHRNLMSDDQIAALEADLIIAAANESNRDVFERKLSLFQKQPMSGSKLTGLTQIARAIKTLDNTLAENLLRKALADKAISGQQRLQLLTMLAEIASSRGGEADSYGNWKHVQLEILTLADKDEFSFRVNKFQYNKAYENGDYIFAYDLVRRALEANATDYDTLIAAAQGAFITNDLKTATVHLQDALSNERLNKDRRDFTEVLLFFAEKHPVTAFDSEFADKKYTSEEKLRLLYRASEFLFRCDQYERCRAIYAEVKNNMFLPLEKKTFAVKYDPLAPKTAEGWTHTASYKDWKQMETRFVPHGDLLDFRLQNDIDRLLKDAVQPEIPTGYETGVYFLCNDEGLHIYVRADDPHVDEIVALKRRGGGFDMNFKAGTGNAPHNIWFKDLPDATGGYIVDWASPTKNYSLSRDIFKRDAVTTPTGIAAHVFVPWLHFCTQLPFDGNDWQFGMIRNVPGVGRQALTGNHQEFGRLVHLTFDLKPQQQIEMKRRVASMSFNAYSRLRNDANGFILAWKDDALGDPAFFSSVLEPLLKELDEAGARLADEQALRDKDVDALFAKYVPIWGSIKYVVAEKRAAYLQDIFFK